MAIEHPPPLTAGGDAWVLRRDGFDPHVERGIEGAFAVSNGSFGVRAAVEEGSPASNSMVLVAGVFVPAAAPAGQTLLTLPDPALAAMSVDRQPLRMSAVETSEHWRELDLRTGEVRRSWMFVDERGRRWQLESLRAASAADPDVYLHRLAMRIVEDDDPAAVSLRFVDVAALATRRSEQGQGGVVRIVTSGEVPGLSVVRTERDVRARCTAQEGELAAQVSGGAPLVVESMTRFGADAHGEGAGFAEALAAHRDAWRKRWDGCDVAVEGHKALQTGVRFALYHLLSASAVNEGRTSIGARNLSGEAYHGHIFWDTEVFMLPALAFSRPDAARSALMYRYRTLDAARERARSLGYRGALYPWESTDTGDDRTPASAKLPDGTMLRILNGEQEHHISAAVPYGVMRYWRASGDDAFMRDYGAEMVFECARFWAGRVTPADGGYSIRKVIGPDEYHTGVDNDAYTNAMASWTLRTAAALAGDGNGEVVGAERLIRKLRIEPREADEWRAAAGAITRASFIEDRVYEQFDGFFALDDVDVASVRQAGVPIDMALGFDAVQRSRAIKQADVLMTAALAPDLWTEASLRRNFAYYEPLTAHGSSLSPPMHALLSAWLRDSERCRAYLDETVAIDLGDGFRGAAGGVHVAALGGLWQAVVFGLAGFKFSRERIEFDPFLPDGVTSLGFMLQWQGRRVDVRIGRNVLDIGIDGEPCPVRVNHDERIVEQGQRASFLFDPTVTFWSSKRRKDASYG